MSYWAQWVWDFPHIAVGVSEAVLGFCATWRITHRTPASEKPQWEPGPWHGGRRTYHHTRDCRCSSCKRQRIEARERGKPPPPPPGGGGYRGGAVSGPQPRPPIWRGNKTARIDIPDDWRETMARKEGEYRRSIQAHIEYGPKPPPDRSGLGFGMRRWM